MARLKPPPAPTTAAGLPARLADRDRWAGSISDMAAYNAEVRDWAEDHGLMGPYRVLDHARLTALGIRPFTSRDRAVFMVNWRPDTQGATRARRVRNR